MIEIENYRTTERTTELLSNCKELQNYRENNGTTN